MSITNTWPLILTLLLAISGCGTSQPSRFYLLNASNSAPLSSGESLTLGLGPIEFPAYLDRSKIMVRSGNNSFNAAEYHRWAEPLETNFTQVLAQELRNALPHANISIYPWRNSNEIKLQVRLEVLSFDSDHHKQARLIARWQLIGSDKKPLGPPQQRQYIKTARTGEYDARVAAMSECVTALGLELAQAIDSVNTP